MIDLDDLRSGIFRKWVSGNRDRVWGAKEAISI